MTDNRVRRRLSKEQKKNLIKLIPFAFLLIAYFSGLLVEQLALASIGFEETTLEFTLNPLVALYLGLFEKIGIALTLVFTAALTLILTSSKMREAILDFAEYTDNRGVSFAKAGTYGTAGWCSEEDIKKSTMLTVSPIEKNDGVILAKLDESTEKIVSLKKDAKGSPHVILLGATGSGKSRGYIRSNILNSIQRGESLVIADPKGELYESMSSVCRASGMKVLVYNLKDPIYSDSWPVLDEIIDPETGNADPDRAAQLADIIIKNTGTSKESIWNDGPMNLIKGLALLAIYEREKEICAGMENLLTVVDRLCRSSSTYSYKGEVSDQWIRDLRKVFSHSSTVTMNDRKKCLRLYLNLTNIPEEELLNIWTTECGGNGIKEASLATVFQYLTNSAKVSFAELFASVDEFNPAKIAYNVYAQAGEKVQSSFVQGLAVRLSLLASPSVRRIVRNKGIVMSDISKERTACFLILPDADTSKRALSSLFFTFLFKDLRDSFDNEKDKSKRLPVHIVMDELANIGLVPDFDNVISMARSRKIRISFAIQNTSQLKDIYGINKANTIISGAGTMLFLGSTDPETCKSISQMTGEATITVSTIKESRGIMRPEGIGKDYQTSSGEGKRYVMTEHEVRSMPFDECLVFAPGMNVIKANKFWWEEHPLANKGKLEFTPINTSERADVKYADTEMLDPYLKDTTKPIINTDILDSANWTEENIAAGGNEENIYDCSLKETKTIQNINHKQPSEKVMSEKKLQEIEKKQKAEEVKEMKDSLSEEFPADDLDSFSDDETVNYKQLWDGDLGEYNSDDMQF